MAAHFFDTSALLKRYVQEDGSAFVRALCNESTVIISELTIAEAASALARRSREGVVAQLDARTIFQAFLRDCQTYTVMEITRGQINRACQQLLNPMEGIRLRSLDAMQLASAMSAFERLRRHGISPGAVISADARMLEAARHALLETMNPLTPQA